MIIYLTFNDAPSGIYSSQVIDVVKFMRSQLQISVKLVAFISLRQYLLNKRKLKNELNDALVLPMFPGIKNWRFNGIFLKVICLILQPKTIIGRSVLATQLAFKTGCKNVIYDGRGAIAAEWKEYKVVTDKKMLTQIDELEKQTVLNAQGRIAVSNQLLKYWQHTCAYKNDNHVIIPCTINKVFEELIVSESTIQQARKNLGINSTDVVYVYSGSLSGWQSFDLLYKFIKPILSNNQNVKLLFISGVDNNILKLQEEFGNRVLCKKVLPDEVPALLLTGDYGLLIREQSTTNLVASPVKFAEYLACGLKIIISEQLGDYSNFVIENNCGSLFFNYSHQGPVTINEKQKLRQLALSNFTKGAFVKMYQKITNLS